MTIEDFSEFSFQQAMPQESVWWEWDLHKERLAQISPDYIRIRLTQQNDYEPILMYLNDLAYIPVL